MKKLFCLFSLFILVATAYAVPRNVTFYDEIGPTYTRTVNAGGDCVNISSAATTTAGIRNCLTDISVAVSSNSVQTNMLVTILDTGTTIYAVGVSTGNPANPFFNETNPLCAQPNHQMNICVNLQTANGTSEVSYHGYRY